jgi:hypothetical protein
MRKRFTHILLVLAVAVQPLASYGAMMASPVNMQADAPPVSCHDEVIITETESDHGCCDFAQGGSCSMTCASVSAAVAAPVTLRAAFAHLEFSPATGTLSPSRPLSTLFKPPRTR